jgi:CHAT domain-containing protein/Flp pilus assembly protein TadD
MHPEYVCTLFEEGLEYIKSDDYAPAILMLKEAYDIAERNYKPPTPPSRTPSSPERVSTNSFRDAVGNAIGNAISSLFASGIQTFVAENLVGRNEYPSPESIALPLCYAYLQAGDVESCTYYGQRGLNTALQRAGAESQLSASFRMVLASRQLVNGDFEAAELTLISALTIHQREFGTSSDVVATNLRLLGFCYFLDQKWLDAEVCLRAALATSRQDTSGEDSLLNLVLAEIYIQVGIYSLAQDLLQPSKTFSWDPESQLFRHGVLARLYRSLGDSARAESEVELARATSPTLRTVNRRLSVEGEKEFGSQMAALPLFRLPLGPALYAFVADIFEDLGMTDRAILTLQSAVTNHQQGALGQGLMLAKLGHIALNKGETEQAETYLRKARPLFAAERFKGSNLSALILSDLAKIHFARGDYAGAASLLEAVFAAGPSSSAVPSAERIRNLRFLAQVSIDLGDIPKAQMAAAEAANAEQILLSDVLASGPEGLKLNYHLASHPFDLLATLGNALPLWDCVIRQKGIVLDSLLEDRFITTGTNQSSRELDDLEELVFHSETETNLASALKRESMVKPLNESTLLGHHYIRDSLKVSGKDVEESLPSDSALLEFLRYSHYEGAGRWQLRYGVLLVQSNQPPRWISLGAAKDIEELIQRYQTAIRGHYQEQELVTASRGLYDRLWVPVEQHFRTPVRLVVLSPDANLNLISFGALFRHSAEDIGHFLCEDYVFKYVTSSRDFVLRPKRPHNVTRGVVLFGDAAFDAPLPATAPAVQGSRPNYDTQVFPYFPPLTFSADEIGALQTEFRKAGFTDISLFTNVFATKAALSELPEIPQILHIATHGYVEMSNQTAVERYFSMNSVDKSHSRPGLVRNPMCATGLAFAGANRIPLQVGPLLSKGQIHPGIMTATEAAKLSLNGCWLVCLSACDTGLGFIQAGEGVLGLRRGFSQAGAQNVLMTLWPIDDDYSARFFVHFYQSLLPDGSPEATLAQVQRERLAQLRENGLFEAVRLAGGFIISGAPSDNR